MSVRNIFFTAAISVLLVVTTVLFVVRPSIFKAAPVNDNATGSGSQTIVENGSVRKIVTVDDAVIREGEPINLAFPMAGTIEKRFVGEGATVSSGDSLIQLDTTELDLHVRELEANLREAQAYADKVAAGATKNDIALSKTERKNAKISVSDAKKKLVDVIKSAYTAGEDAVRGKTNQMFTDPNGASPSLVFVMSDPTLAADIISRRHSVETVLQNWSGDVAGLGSGDDMDKNADETKNNLRTIQDFLDKLSYAVSGLVADNNLSSDTLASWVGAISAARGSVDAARLAVGDAIRVLDQADGQHAVADDALTLKEGGSPVQDMAVARARVDMVNVQLDLANHSLDVATIKAPAVGKVTDFLVKEHETVGQGAPVAIFSTIDRYIETDVPEDKIRNVSVGNAAEVTVKALPGQTFSGTVRSIEAKETMKDGDVYYRAQVTLDQYNDQFRPGMTASVAIGTGGDETALRVPLPFIERRGGKEYVYVDAGGKRQEMEVQLGISDGSFVEITSGLKQGQSIVNPDLVVQK